MVPETAPQSSTTGFDPRGKNLLLHMALYFHKSCRVLLQIARNALVLCSSKAGKCSSPTDTELIQLLRQPTGTDLLGTREMYSSARGGQSIKNSLKYEYVTQETVPTTLA